MAIVVTGRLLTVRTFGGALVALSVALCPSPAFAADPGTPGPFTVVKTEYDEGDLAFEPTDFPIRVEVRASVHHPSNLGAGPFPLVLFMHGRHSTCFAGPNARTAWPCPAGYQPIPSYEGYEYIAEILASHGYVVVSISANGINARDDDTDDDGMSARAELFQHHLEKWREFNTTGGDPFGGQFIGTVDLDNVGTMGHSRGGEGAVFHYRLNLDQGSPFGIRAVLPLAPTDFSRRVIHGVPMGVVLPYCDGDVSDLQGVHYYDDARYSNPRDSAFLHTFLVLGANHNYFNTFWTPAIFPPGSRDDWPVPNDPHCGSGASRLSDEEQRGVGLAYVSGFFRRYLRGRTVFQKFLTGGEPPPPSALGAEVHTSFHAPRALRKDVNRQFPRRFGGVSPRNNLGGDVEDVNLDPFRLCGAGGRFQPARCIDGEPDVRQPHTTGAATRGGLSQLELGWADPAAAYRNLLPERHRDVSAFSALQFRVGVDYSDPSNGGQPQDFSVVLTDGGGTTATVPVSLVSDALFFPPGDPSLFYLVQLPDGTIAAAPNPVPRLFLNMVRVPLAAFVGVDLTDVESIELRFDETAQGNLMLTDLALANLGQALDVFFVVDLSGSFGDDLVRFKQQAPEIISTIQSVSSDTDVRFGLGSFVDYPISPFGSSFSEDYAYRREVDLTADIPSVLQAIEDLEVRFGSDFAESQLVALYQAATGEGQDLSGEGFPEASIPPGQQANFRPSVTKIFLLWTDAPFHRPGDPGTIPYPGPTFEETVEAILALDPPLVVGVAGGSAAIPDLTAMAVGTDALAPADVDCDGDGTVDIPTGDPLVCAISSTGVGIGEAVASLVAAAGAAAGSGVAEVVIDVRPGNPSPKVNLKARNGVLPVALLTTDEFDATTADPETLAFGPGSAPPAHPGGHLEDVDGDGDTDLMLHFRIGDCAIFPGESIVALSGFDFDGMPFEGYAEVIAE